MLTDAEKERIVSGIAAYKKSQNLLLRILRRYKSFSENDFDRWFRNERRYFVPLGMGCDGDSFILGMGLNGGTYWAFMLDLMQKMMMIGLIKTKTINGVIFYEKIHAL